MRIQCFDCEVSVEAGNLENLGDRFLEHARSAHDWPFPDQGIKNYAAATQRLTGPSERVEEAPDLSIEEVTGDRIDHWLNFFDHDAFVGMPEWASCYCLEPHVRRPDGDAQEGPEDDVPHWRDNRSAMVERLEAGESFGYLAYDGRRAIGWVNASRRDRYALYRGVDPDGPDPETVIGVSCFIVAPPYRRHHVAASLLDRVIEDAGSRKADWIEGYPFNGDAESDSGNFRGPVSMYETRGFQVVEVRERDTVMRRRVRLPVDSKS
jgi:GNAT superfamily N-acetyltransferase